MIEQYPEGYKTPEQREYEAKSSPIKFLHALKFIFMRDGPYGVLKYLWIRFFYMPFLIHRSNRKYNKK